MIQPQKHWGAYSTHVRFLMHGPGPLSQPPSPCLALPVPWGKQLLLRLLSGSCAGRDRTQEAGSDVTLRVADRGMCVCWMHFPFLA